MALSRNPYNH